MRPSTIVVFVLGIGIGGAAIYFLGNRAASEPARDAPTEPRKIARAASALGRIQPAGGVLDLGTPLPDQVGRLLVKEGETVKKGDVLVELRSHADRQMELDLLDRQIKEAEEKLKGIEATGALQLKLDELQLEQLKEQGPLDIGMQKLKVGFLEKQAEHSREGLSRVAELTSLSRQEKDQQELLVLQTQAELAGARELIKKLTLGEEHNVKLAQAKMELARATLERTRKEVPVASLEQQRKMAVHRLALTTLKAPADGKVLKIMAHPGELVGPPLPILQMADLSEMVVLAEVYETDIDKIFEGQRVDISSKVERAGKMTGKVLAIGAMIGKNRVYDVDPLADVDRRVIDVRVLLDQPAQAAGLINLQVNVDFQPR